MKIKLTITSTIIKLCVALTYPRNICKNWTRLSSKRSLKCFFDIAIMKNETKWIAIFLKPIFHVIVTDTQIFDLTFTEIVLMWFLKQMKKKSVITFNVFISWFDWDVLLSFICIIVLRIHCTKKSAASGRFLLCTHLKRRWRIKMLQ